MNINGLLCDILTYVPIAVLSIYISAYLALKYSFYSRIERNRDSIRMSVAKQWVKEHKNLITLIDNVDVKYIRVLVKRTRDEDRGFRILQAFFVLCSFAVFMTGIIVNRTTAHTAFHEYLLISETVLYCAVLTLVIFKSYYEFRFYQLLEELENNG